MIINKLDWINPILVREYQQAVRSKGFIWVFELWLISQLLISLIYIYSVDATRASLTLQGPGQSYFNWLFAGLAVVFLFLLPWGGFNRMVRERVDTTYELLVVSRITPTQVCLGYLLLVLTHILIYLFMSFPFLIFAYLLRGLDLRNIGWMMYFLILATFVVNAFALMSASFCRTQKTIAGARILMGFGMIMGFPMILISLIEGLTRTGRMFGFSAGAVNPWEVIFFSLFNAVLIVVLCFVFMRSNLLFEAANRTTAPRLAVFSMLFVTGITSLCFHWFRGASKDAVEATLIGGFIFLSAYATFILLNESNDLTRRMEESIPKSPLKRFLMLPFLPGRGTASLFLLLSVAMIYLFAFLANGNKSIGNFFDQFNVGIQWGLYLIFFLGIASLVFHWIRNSTRVRIHFAAVAILLVAIFSLVPLLFSLWKYQFVNEDINLWILNPMVTLAQSKRHYGYVLLLFAPIGILGFLPSIRQNLANLRKVRLDDPQMSSSAEQQTSA